MTFAACLVIIGVVGAWWGPRVLQRFTNSGSSPLFGIVLWTSMVVAVLLVLLAAAVLLLIKAWSVTSNPAALARACLSTLEGPAAVWPQVSWIAAGLTALLLPVLAVFGWRVVRVMGASGRMRRKLVGALRATGRRVPGLEGAPLLLDSDVREAYSLAGGSGTVVVTTAAVAKLTPPELAAVLAHEQAHLSGRHHLLLGFLAALHRAVPLVPLFGEAERAVALLLEMRADDVATRRYGRPTLLAALLAMSGRDAPQAALGVGGRSLLPRARRLIVPATRQERFSARLAVSAALLGVASFAALTLGVLLPQACTAVIA